MHLVPASPQKVQVPKRAHAGGLYTRALKARGEPFPGGLFQSVLLEAPSGVPQRKPSSAPAAFSVATFSLVRDSLENPQPGLLLLGRSGFVIWDLTQSLNTRIYGIRHRKPGSSRGWRTYLVGSEKSSTQARYLVKFVLDRESCPTSMETGVSTRRPLT